MRNRLRKIDELVSVSAYAVISVLKARGVDFGRHHNDFVESLQQFVKEYLEDILD